MIMTNAQYAANLRLLADVVENATEELEMRDGHPINVWCANAEELARKRRGLGGSFEKISQGSFLVLRRKVGDFILDLFVSHANACERVEVGTETVEVPDPSVQVPMVKVERPVYEWKCPPSLLSLADEAGPKEGA